LDGEGRPLPACATPFPLNDERLSGRIRVSRIVTGNVRPDGKGRPPADGAFRVGGISPPGKASDGARDPYRADGRPGGDRNTLGLSRQEIAADEELAVL